MTIPQYPVVPASRRLSKSALCSFIFGLLVCVPFATGVLAVLFGLLGLAKTGKPGISGRWMAIVGIILGIASVVGWSTLGTGAWAIWKATEGPRVAAHDFIRDVCIPDDVAAKVRTAGMSDAEFETTADNIRGHGSFVDTTFTSTVITNNSATVSGTAVFDKGRASVTAELEKLGDWKVRRMDVGPIR